MAHRGLRSLKSLLRRKAKTFILNTEFNDYLIAENVCRVTRNEVIDFLATTNIEGEVDMSAVPDIERGLVLSNSRGEGYFQK